MTVQPSTRTVARWQARIKKNGSLTISIRELLEHYGAARRGSRVIKRIEDDLENRTPKIYIRGLADATQGLEAKVQLAHQRTGTEGEPFSATLRRERRGRKGDSASSKGKDEAEFKKRHFDTLLQELRLKRANVGTPGAEQEFSPNGTRDRLDILCENSKGDLVALEFKVEGGERRAVEQLLRYISQVHCTRATDIRLAAYKDASVYGVLVTGVADLASKNAIETLDMYEMIEWSTYAMKRGESTLGAVTRQLVERGVPARPLHIERSADVRVTETADSRIDLRLQSFQARLSRTAARRLKTLLDRMLSES